MKIRLDKETLSSLTEVVSADHPLSLGRNLLIHTDHVSFKGFKSDRESLNETFGSAKGMFMAWSDVPHNVIMIRQPKDNVRLVELIVHEVSHYVDHLLERAHVQTIDTEVRAYYLDWIVGKVLHNFNVFKEDPTRGKEANTQGVD